MRLSQISFRQRAWKRVGIEFVSVYFGQQSLYTQLAAILKHSVSQLIVESFKQSCEGYLDREKA